MFRLIRAGHRRRPARRPRRCTATGRDRGGRTEGKTCGARGDGPAVHCVVPLSLTFDHRAVTGAEAARFLHAVVEDLQRAE